MVERKKHFANVAFGGGWSEDLVAAGELFAVLDVLRRAARECGMRDVRDEALGEALAHVHDRVEKGPMLVDGLRRALAEPDPARRVAQARRYVKMIEEWAGV